VSEDDYNQVIGQSVEACWDWMWESFKLTEPAATSLPPHDRPRPRPLERPPEPLPGVRRLISELRRLGVPIAVASASLRAWVDATLRGLGPEGALDAAVLRTRGGCGQ